MAKDREQSPYIKLPITWCYPMMTTLLRELLSFGTGGVKH